MTYIRPNRDNFEVLRVEQINEHMVLEVQYPNCIAAAYEGKKILVYLNVPIIDVIRWRSIDPHFRVKACVKEGEAPEPAARFPANPRGWADALSYAASKVVGRPTIR